MRLQTWILLIVILILNVSIASAKLTGQHLLVSCQSAIKLLNNDNTPTDDQHAYKQVAYASACEGYITGVAESIPSTLFCPPSDNDYQQFMRVVYGYLSNHPKELNLPASALTFKVLTDTFPCQKNNRPVSNLYLSSGRALK